MANKSSKSPTGETRGNQELHMRKEEPEAQDIMKSGPSPDPDARMGKQENLTNRGFQEDQPKNPVRSTGSMSKDQETGPTGEPDRNESRNQSKQ